MLLIVCLMMSLLSFSQTDINKDSLICVPRNVLVEVVTELSLCDFYKEEAESLKQDTTDLNRIIHQRNVIIQSKDFELIKTQESLQSCIDAHSGLQLENKDLIFTNTKLKEQNQKLTKGLIFSVTGNILLVFSALLLL
jgi:hypothetical protein